MSRRPGFRFRKVLKVIGIVLGVLVVLVYVGFPAGSAVFSVLPARKTVGAPPPGFEKVTLHAADGVALSGWQHPSANGAAIILLPGAGESRESIRPYAEMLVRYGYGVLALDLRGHGESKGQTNKFGWQGTSDVGGAVDLLQQQGEVQRIGGLGISLGGEVLLGAASAYPAMGAIVADGATQRTLHEYVALESNRPLVRNFVVRVMYGVVSLLTGQQPPKPLLESMQAAEDTRYLFIAAGSNDLEVEFNELFRQTLGERASLWVAPGVSHTGAFGRYPTEYEQRVIEFFDTSLLTN